MVDFNPHVDPPPEHGRLRVARDTLAAIAELLEGPALALAQAEGPALGVGRLVERMDDFSGEWEHGVAQLGECAEAAVRALDMVLWSLPAPPVPDPARGDARDGGPGGACDRCDACGSDGVIAA
ncbi:hypothetical protein [Streptomyces marincola]|uniref:Uncharacterized protein n=1 Tax=Streptomyces marincola TaxID=2878388 RepID=A0A1W7CW04_9ACTN|nr:hypothetical protein [Streptomyces marincola]ARQ68520.1 hypothetical protein CAG99_06315 [Streptomyces marincola]